jgi:hypothetical protein
MTLTDMVAGAVVYTLLLATTVQGQKRLGRSIPMPCAPCKAKSSSMAGLPALPIAIPFLAAALLAGIEAIASRSLGDTLAIITAIAVTVICGLLAAQAFPTPIVYWFGS